MLVGRSITEPSSSYKIISVYLLGHKAQFSIGPAVLKKGVIFLFNQHKKYFMSFANTIIYKEHKNYNKLI